MFVKKIKRFLRGVQEFILNKHLFYAYVVIHEKYLRTRLHDARGRYHSNRIKDLGVNSKMRGESVIHYVENLHIGDHVRVGEGAFFFCKGGIYIGDNTQVSRNVLIYSADHDINGSAIPFDDQYIDKPVRIGKAVWIGMNVVITPGVTIGDGAVIGMGTVVSKDIPVGAVVVGAPQRIVNHRDMDAYAEKDAARAWFAKEYPTI